MDSPAALHEKLRALAPMHLKKGVKKEQLPRFGQCLVNMLEGILKENFTKEYRAAWEWLWTWLSQSLEQSLEEAVCAWNFSFCVCMYVAWYHVYIDA